MPFIIPLYAQRLPTPSYLSIKYGRKTSSISSLKDPYTQLMKLRFEDAWRADPTVRRAIDKKVQFVLGKHPKSVLDTRKEFTAYDEMKKKAFDDVVGNKTYQEMKSKFDQINQQVNLRGNLKSSLVQCKVLGRSVLFIEKDKEGYPAALKKLNCFKLGQVTADVGTWEFKSVEYNEFEAPDNILQAEDILYFTNLDYHVSPNTLYYGVSDIEPIAHCSESNRLIDEVDLKEINRSLWAAFGLINFQTKNDTEIANFLRSYRPGSWIGTNLAVDVQVFKVEHELENLLKERDDNEKRMLRGLGLPTFMNGFEDVTNRATTLTIAQLWKEVDLEDERTDLKDQLEPQWCESFVIKYLDIKTEKELNDLEVKLKMEFEDIAFETLGEKVEALVPLYNLGFISPERFLTMVGLEDVADEVKTEQEKRLAFLREQAQALGQVQGGGGGGAAGGGGQVPIPGAEDQGRDAGGRFAPKIKTFDKLNKDINKQNENLKKEVTNKQTSETGGKHTKKKMKVKKPNSDYIE